MRGVASRIRLGVIGLSLLGIALLPLTATAANPPPPVPRCPGPGISGDRADLRGIRFYARRPVGVVAIGLAGDVAGTYLLDVALRQSEGFVGLVEAGTLDYPVALPIAATPPYPTVLLSLPVFLGPPDEGIFSLSLAGSSGPGLLYFETHGAGTEDFCPHVEGTNENDVATPTLRGDPAGFYVLGQEVAFCPSDGDATASAVAHGIRFHPLGARFETIGVGLRASVAGVYQLAALIRRSRGFFVLPERTVGFTATLADSIATHPFPMSFFDFAPIEVQEEEEPFTLQIVQISGPLGGSVYLEEGPSCTQAATTWDATSDDPAGKARSANFVAAMPEPEAAAGLVVALAAVAAIARATRP